MGVMQMDIQLKKGVLDMCILFILKEQDSYGYDITEKISKYIDVSEGTVYPILRKLKEDNFLTTYLMESMDGPQRKYYKITDLGQKRYLKLKEDWDTINLQVSKLIKENA